MDADRILVETLPSGVVMETTIGGWRFGQRDAAGITYRVLDTTGRERWRHYEPISTSRTGHGRRVFAAREQQRIAESLCA